MRIVKMLMTFSLLILCGLVGYLAWLMMTPITVDTVETRIFQGCLVSNTVALVPGADAGGGVSTGLLTPARCQCVAAGVIAGAGRELAAELADAMRLQVLASVKSMLSGAGAAGARRSPHQRGATRMMYGARRVLRNCDARQ